MLAYQPGARVLVTVPAKISKQPGGWQKNPMQPAWPVLIAITRKRVVITYYSTNGQESGVTLAHALLTGQASDRGLYLPERYPTLSRQRLCSLADRSYADVAFEVLRPFAEGTFEEATLRAVCADAYDFDVPLEPVTNRHYLMRLDRGPTASFKDFAARMMSRWMSLLMKQQGGRLVVLTATSGDTGSAVAHAYHGVDRVEVVVLFPIDEVSDRQRRQMTTLGGNVTTIAVNGKFDDCQALVKQAFADPDLKSIRLTSANSINIGRLLPQSVYYVYAYTRLADVAAGERAVFCIPSGNFGDMMGGVIARQMGLPISKFIIATNANDEVPRFLETGEYRPIVPSRVCASNAMNVGHPSNLARLVDVYGGWMDEQGNVKRPPAMERMRTDLFAISIDDEWTRRTIREAYGRHATILEPHGAVGWAGLQHWLATAEGAAYRDPLCVSIETAHPAKFPDEIRATINVAPETPPSLVGLDEMTESYESMEHVEYAWFRDWLLKLYT